MRQVNNCPTRCDYVQFFLYFCKLLYTFRVLTPPIIRSTYNCNYSQLKMRSMDPSLLPSAIAEGSRER